jgi:predicted RNA-binding protein YlxR (DUF448 family)
MKPVRTCVGCRQRTSQTELLRVVCVDFRIEPDAKGVLLGRGAWVHPSSNCTKTAIERRAFARAFRVSVQLETAGLITFIEQAETMLATNE